MGIYTEYIGRALSHQNMETERKKILKQISDLRGGRDVLVIASDANRAAEVNVAISLEDFLPIKDQVANLSGEALDVILETPGGSGEVAERIVRILRQKYKSVAFIVPGMAMSAGTIMVMSGDEILMDETSALGPIDAQIVGDGKAFSAEALIKGFEKIMEEVDQKQSLNRAYIPMLQKLSPGELQSAQNALDFAKVLVTDWLTKYKFQNWANHSTTGKPVTKDEKEVRAEEIAGALCNHSQWLTHSRFINMADLNSLGLKITDYGKNPDLANAIRRFEVLLKMLFDSNIYKVYETPISQIYKQVIPQVIQGGSLSPEGGGQPRNATLDITCKKCGKTYIIQADFGEEKPLEKGAVRFPKDDKLLCSQCGTMHDLSTARRAVEAKAGKEIFRG